MNAPRHKWGPTEQKGGEAVYVATCVHCRTVKGWVVLPFRRAPKFLTYTSPRGEVTNLAPACEPVSAAERTLPLFVDDELVEPAPRWGRDYADG